MRRFISSMAARSGRQFAPLKDGAAANSHLPKLKVGDTLTFGSSPL